ncbi:type II toxin-antitoxin system RelE/ParE family toxin [Desmonostoc muscorum LEGE 12446]|uniref:Type II toxin-antitoxin system RelE/ParE family toxin n=1 Tax=Desmonostoc muscorum LEGE 12446 TaxID=1828758 RepID=A0A8J6ZWY2_DESMC|nr:type II toxin-antitoxin system RelE/ParE family toxin [Desmonostoc muscorum]MCF2145416.1 type II toxin-antitoxin system RelE/ParE family toxin [Desmonostoc muscorum LEGE 12446]
MSTRAAKELKKLSADIRDRFNDKILALAENTRPSGVVKLENADNKYRIRVGNYSILYEIQDEVLIIKVVRLGHRRDVYQDE